MSDFSFYDLPESVQSIAAQCLADVISSNGVSDDGQRAAKSIGKAFIELYISGIKDCVIEETTVSEPITIQDCIDKVRNASGMKSCQKGSR